MKRLEVDNYINTITTNAIPKSLTIDKLVTLTNSDPELQVLKNALVKGSRKKEDPKIKCYREVFNELTV